MKNKNYFVQIMSLKGSFSIKLQSDGDCPKNTGVRIPYQPPPPLLFLTKNFLWGKKFKPYMYILFIPLSFSALDSYQMNVIPLCTLCSSFQ